ncbi:MAG: STAS domain-containing protein [Candidatus Acidiferrum sp.]
MTGSPQPTTPAFHVRCYRTEQSVVVECHGKLTFEHAPHLRTKVHALLPEEKRITLDLKEVPFMDSSGLGALATLYVAARTRGCKLELINVSQAMRTLLSMTNLLSLFEDAGRYGGKIP